MKKKIVKVFLMAALVVTALGTLNSCKDYDEDNYSDLQEKLTDQNASLNEVIKTQVQLLQGQIDNLTDVQNKCKANYANLKDSLSYYLTKVEAASTYETKKDAQTKYDELKGLFDGLSTSKVSQDQLTTAVADLNTAITSATSAMNTKYESQQEAINSLTKTVNDLNTTSTTVSELVKKVAELETKLSETSTLASTNASDISNLKSQVALNKEDIKKLTDGAAVIEKTIAGWEDQLKTVTSNAAAAMVLAKQDSIRIDVLEKSCAEAQAKGEKMGKYLKYSIDSLAEVTKNLKTDIDDVRTLANQNLADSKKYTDDAIALVKESIKANTDSIKNNTDDIADLKVTLGDFKSAYEAADTKLQNQIDELTKNNEALTAKVAANTLSIDKLTNMFTNIMSKWITGVIIQGTVNPVFGSVALPMDVRSTVLAAYYGKVSSSNGLKFPTARQAFYANGDETLTEGDMTMLALTGVKDGELSMEADETIISDAADNAGTLYLTVNPNTADFTGTEFTMVNSLDEESGVKLNPLVKSDHKLTFGNTKAATNNAFYEAKAHLDAANIENVKAKIDVNALKDVVKDVLTPTDGVNVSNVVKTLYNQFTDVLDANGVKATWKDSLGTHSTYSQYSIAATAIKPLSYAFMKDANYTKLPGIDRAENFIAKMVDKINIKMPTFNIDEIQTPNIKNIELEALSPELLAKFKVTQTITIDNVITVPGTTIDGSTIIVKDPLGNVLPVSDIVVKGQDIQLNITKEVSIDMTDAIKEMYDEMNKPIGDVNDMIDQIKNYISDVNNLLGEIDQINDLQTQIDDAKTDIKSQLTNYLNKFNNKVCNLLNRANDALQPVLLVKTTDGFAKLSQVKTNPSHLGGTNFILIPTSYTAEILAPAYKKFIGVTNIYSKDLSKNAQDNGGIYKLFLKQVNGETNVATVMDGATRSLEMSIKPDYVYEIAYSAVDYRGLNVVKKFYVTVDK